jgi:hypothetical protein
MSLTTDRIRLNTGPGLSGLARLKEQPHGEVGTMVRSVMLSAIAVLSVAAVAAPPAAAEFPEGPVTFVVPFSPGGSNDIMARQI